MGLLRLFLALSVVAGHSQSTVFGLTGPDAFVAVNIFFIISGFYMAMVLNGKYKDLPIRTFYKSRLLRLLPVYYVGLALSLLVSFDAIRTFFATLTGLGKVLFVLSNGAIFGQDLWYVGCVKTVTGDCASPVGMTINPPSWSLAVELGFYALAPFIVRSVKWTSMYVLFGAVYLLSLNFINFPLQGFQAPRFDEVALSYFFYPASFIFFGCGVLAYHLSKGGIRNYYLPGIAAFILFSFAPTTFPGWQIILISLVVPVLFHYTKSIRADRIIGELSYPVYILHFPILLFLQGIEKDHPRYFSVVSIGTWVAVLSMAAGLILYYTLETAVNKYRYSQRFLSAGGEPQLVQVDGRVSVSRWILGSGVLSVYFALPVFVVAYYLVAQT